MAIHKECGNTECGIGSSLIACTEKYQSPRVPESQSEKKSLQVGSSALQATPSALECGESRKKGRPPPAPRSRRRPRSDETTGPRDAPLHRTSAEPNGPLQGDLHEERRPDSRRYETALGGVAQVTSRRQRWAAGGA